MHASRRTETVPLTPASTDGRNTNVQHNRANNEKLAVSLQCGIIHV
ncbi:MAG: hypothetical protein QOD67_4472, partial [Caballeronia sp.]|nr:hypothetical protein [Caballeronia sp.]